MASRDTRVEKGQEKVAKSFIAGRSLRMPGLKPSDYYLFKESKALFNFDMRQVFILGLRLIYRCLFDARYRALLYELADEINKENLDIQDIKVVYENFSKIRAL